MRIRAGNAYLEAPCDGLSACFGVFACGAEHVNKQKYNSKLGFLIVHERILGQLHSTLSELS